MQMISSNISWFLGVHSHIQVQACKDWNWQFPTAAISEWEAWLRTLSVRGCPDSRGPSRTPLIGKLQPGVKPSASTAQLHSGKSWASLLLSLFTSICWGTLCSPLTTVLSEPLSEHIASSLPLLGEGPGVRMQLGTSFPHKYLWFAFSTNAGFSSPPLERLADLCHAPCWGSGFHYSSLSSVSLGHW